LGRHLGGADFLLPRLCLESDAVQAPEPSQKETKSI
jgi:hypothetical protein